LPPPLGIADAPTVSASCNEVRVVVVWVVVVVCPVSPAQPLNTKIAPAARLTAKREKIFIPASCVLG
jgi:hypothetical protein